MKRFLHGIVFITFLFLLPRNAIGQTNQIVNGGTATAPANFPGTGCLYTWVNDTPGIGLAANGTGNIPSFTAINTTGSPITATITATPVPNAYAYIANFGSNSVSVISTATNTVARNILVGTGPGGVSVSPDGSRVYVVNANTGSAGTVSVINTITNTVAATVPVGLLPLGVAVSPDDSRAYVTNILSNTVSVINTSSNSVVNTIPVGAQPRGIAVSPDGSRVYTANYNSNDVSVINTATNTVAATIAMGAGAGCLAVAISPDGSRVYVTNGGVANTVAVIDPTTNTVIATIRVGGTPDGISVSPDGSRVYVANGETNNVSVINALTNLVVSTISVGTTPWGISISPDGSRVFVANFDDGTTSVINTGTNRVTSTIRVGSQPESEGNFISGGMGCSGSPVTFTITVNPGPGITVGLASGSISACPGTASASPFIQQFTVSGSNLTGNITATAPTNFEVSLAAGSGFGNSVILTQSNGTVNNAMVYVRSAGSAPTGNISGNVVLASTGVVNQNVAVTGIVNALPTVNTVSNQVVLNGAATTAVNFTGTANTFTWVNDTPGIGLPAGGTGNIASFTAVNTGSTAITATITVTPASGACTGTPITFSITVNPTAPPVITIGVASGTISACVGTASASPNIQQFTFSGTNLSANFLASASPGFEVALAAAGPYYNVVTANQFGGIVNGTVYVRSSASASVGNISGNVTVTSTGATNQNVAVTGTVNALPTVSAVANQIVNSGTATIPINFTGTGQAFSWTNNTPGIGITASGSGNIPSFTAVNTGSTPVTATFTVTPVPAGFIYTANANRNTVSVINSGSNTVVATISVGQYPLKTVVTPDGNYVYVINQGGTTVSAIDALSNTVIATITVGMNPEDMAITPDGSKIYVSNASPNNISVINTATNTVIATIPVGVDPMHSAISPDGSHFYVANFGSSTISVINTTTNLVEATINSIPGAADILPSPDGTRLYVTSRGSNSIIIINTATNSVISSIAVGNYPQGTSISPDGNRLYTSNQFSNNVSVINTATNTLAATIPAGNYGLGTAISPDGNYVYVTNRISQTISVINTLNNAVTTTIPVAGLLDNPVMSPDGSRLYITDDGSNTVHVINTATNTVVANIPAGTNPLLYPTSISKGNGCSGTPITFTITVNPTAAVPIITTGAVTGTISACVGTASASPNIQQFTVSGANLSANIIASAPAGFEVALAAAGPYFNVVTANQIGGIVNGTVYVRSSTSASAGNISGNITVTSTGATSQTVAVTGTVNALPTVNAVANQTVTNGAATTPVNFIGTANTYNWVNNTPGIGMAANGTGNIAPFTAVYAGNIPITATITVTPVSGGCTGTPVTFTITVNPTVLSPTIVAGTATGSIAACAGTASSSPNIQQIIVSGNNLTNNITVAAPAGFEVSLTQGSGYGSSIIVPQGGGTVNNVVVYVRSAASASAGNITGNVVLTSAGATSQNVAVAATVNALATVNQVANQNLANGAATTAVNFTGTGVIYQWANNNPAIGLGASGTGNIPSFTVTNNTNNFTIATITVTPMNSQGCSGSFMIFTITISPTIVPAITAAGILSALNTTYGTPSASTQFNVSGTNMPSAITVASPPGFEISTNNLTFTNTVNVGAGGTITPTPVYIRLKSSTPAGNYAGNILLTGTGPTNASIAMPNSTVTPAPLSITADNKNKIFGTINPVLTITYNGFVNNDGPMQLTTPASIITAAVTTSPVGQYPITVSGAISSNYVFTYIPGLLTINPVVQIGAAVIVPNMFTPNGDGINDTWDIKNLSTYINCTVEIFNRYGAGVYFSNGYPIAWDGKYKGVELPVGTYYYIINTGSGGKAFSGYVTIIR